MGFLRRAQRLLIQRTPATLDYGVLVATLEAMQSSSATARAQVRAVHGDEEAQASREPLIEILLATPHWPEAIAVQEGSFHRGAARPTDPR